MALGVIFLVITLFAIWGCIRQLRQKNLFGSGYAFLCFLAFGWFGVMSVYAAIWGGGAVSGT